ncbi:hypothetical protein FB451DRAFT_1285635 [Mycena latifolia]|nr:hypothetical protein FB451DRAFT_1285635 [Mycena latifolia]
MYMENLLEHINSGAQLRIPRNADSPDEAETPHIASAFLIERTHDTEDVPLALCKSWPDLCIFLDIFLDGDKESHFITSGNFGLRVPTQKELLSRESWNLWVSHLNKDAGKLPVTLDLYAIMWDASDRCPQCKIQNPVKHPLPDDLQRCVKCQFTFLESYQDMETIPETPTMPSTAALTRTTNHDYLRNLQPQTPDDSEYQDGTSIPAVPSTSKSPDVSKTTEPLASVSPETRHCLDIPGPDVADELSFSYPPVPSTQVSGPPSLPKHVQVLRQRKPFQQDSQDDQSTTSLDTPHPMLQTPTTYLGFLYKLYTSVLLGLPHRYYKDAPQPRTLGGDDPGTAPALYKRWTDEWTQMGSIAVVLFGLLFTVLQISSVSYDVVVRTVVWLSMVCLFFGATFAIILSLIFRKLATKTVGVRWIREVTRPPKNHFWNARIMLSMPAVWIIWGVVYFAIFMLVFLWRSGATNEKDEHSKPSPSQEYGPRAFTTFVFVLGVAYLMLILRTATKIGGERMI